MTGTGKNGDQLNGRKSMRRNSGSSCDLLSLATVRSHRGGRLQAESSSDKEEKASCLNSKEEGRSSMKPMMGKGERKEPGRTLRFGQPIILAVPVN